MNETGGKTAVLTVREVARSFPDGRTTRHVLADVSLEVGAGELVALMGPSGSGKTTLLRLAAGLDVPDAGQVIHGATYLSMLDAAGLAAQRREWAGFVEQDLNLIESLTAAENVALPLELSGIRSRDALNQAVGALDAVGLVDLARQFPAVMSGGEQQRVAIARALVGPRRLLLADEPTGALDSMTAESVMRLVRRRCDHEGVGVLMATHDAVQAAWADRVVFLRDGLLVDESVPVGGRGAVNAPDEAGR